MDKMSKKAPYSESEILRLLELYRENKTLLLSSFKSSVTNKKNQDVWQHIVDEINKIGLKDSTVKEVVHKWKDLKSHAKKDISARKYPKTGGGKSPKEGSYTDIIIDIIGEDAPSVAGVPDGGAESGVCRIDDASATTSQHEESMTMDESLPSIITAVRSSAIRIDEDDPSSTEPMKKKKKTQDKKDERDLTREELHRVLLQEEISKVRLQKTNIELEKTKLELEIRKLHAEERARLELESAHIAGPATHQRQDLVNKI